MRSSRQWLLAVAPAVGLAAVVGPVLGAHATATSSGASCVDDTTSSTTAVRHASDDQLGASDDHASGTDGAHVDAGEADGAGDDGGRGACGDDGDGRRGTHHSHRSGGGTTTTTKPSSSGPTASTTTSTSTSTTSTSTTSTSTSTTSTSTTTSTTAAPRSPIGIGEKFTQLANGKPMLLTLTVTNSSATAETLDVTVEVKGTTSLPPYLNVNADSTQKLLANWACTPSEISHPTGDNLFNCLGVVIPAGEIDPVMVTSGSSFTASGDTVSVITTVTKDTPSGAVLPSPVTATATVG